MNPMIPMSGTAGLPAEKAIPNIVVYDLLPRLSDIFMTLQKLKKIWNVPQNNIPGKIVAATMTGESVGGWNPKDLTRWGEALLALDQRLTEPLTIEFADGTTETTTLEAVLLTNYTPME